MTAGSKPMILVTGAGRSGTSTIAGSLHYLGFHVPEPVLKGNESNPRGFFESWWPVRFHKKILQKAPAEQTDGRPDAIELVRAAVDDGHRAELREWLTEVAAAADRVVVKDPRAVWVPWLWVDTAKELGLDISFLTMLRHPTEVLGSRQTYYASGRPHMGKWEFAIWNLCGWINGNLLIEQQTRDHRRTFVRYTDLLGDWRAAMTKVRADLGIELDDDLDPGHTHEIDDFIDADLRRHEVDWSVWELPEELVEIAQATFDGLSQLSDRGGHDPETETLLDEVRDRYDALYRKSAAISQDAASARARQAAADSASAVREELKAKRAAQPKQSAPPAPPPSRFRVAGSKVLTRYPVLRRVRDRLRG
jgi:hypothetical protein